MLGRNLLQFFIALLGAIIIPAGLYFGVPQLAGIPRLLSVSEGLWHARSASVERRTFTELKAPVDIAFDSFGIPHIVAENDEDLYFAQGLLVAHFRLFQMDITSRVAQGRLSDLAGERAVEFDRFFVTMGFRQIVKEETEYLMADADVSAKISAYVKGVNTYIRQLSYRDLPLEYKLLNTWPEEWDAKRMVSLLKVMSFRLSGRSHDFSLTRILENFGSEKTQNLFPEFLPANLEAYFVEPIGKAKRDLNTELNSKIHIKEFPAILNVFEANGSNSWAVGPGKSKTGRSILANDTHLAYQLPSVWFENQLLSPTTNVYGGTFPGIAGVILGMNPNIAWGVTNGTTDATDWSEVEFKDDSSFDYRFDDVFKPATTFDEEIAIRYKPSLFVKVVKTDFGFILHREKNYGLAARWTGDRKSNEFKTINDITNAKSAAKCIEALKNWQSPVQNWTCADEGNIAVYHAGAIPIRKRDEGWVVKPAIGKDSLWSDEIPFDDLPHAMNPESGFVFSANERPVGPSYPYYLSWDFEEPFRGQRIRNLLSGQRKFDGNDFIQLQNDVYNQHASVALPMLLRMVDVKALNDREKAIFQTLSEWDYMARADQAESSMFALWWQNIEKFLWKDLSTFKKSLLPKKARTVWFFRQLQADPEKWKSWIEGYASGEDLVTKALQHASAELMGTYGADPKLWNWANVQKTKFPHVAKIPGFDSDFLSVDGSAYSVLANRGAHGPTWKMVVELGPNPRAWTQFPGGVTGDPLDPNYEEFTLGWSKGEMRPVQFWRDAREAMSNAAYVWRWEAR